MQTGGAAVDWVAGWYAWYETKSKFWLFDIYFFTAVATLPKGPVAPFLVLVIVGALLRLLRKGSGGFFLEVALVAGIALYFAIVLPWFIAVQASRIPPSSTNFSSNHNLERFWRPTSIRSTADLVLRGSSAAGDHALDGDRHAGAGGWSAEVDCRVADSPSARGKAEPRQNCGEPAGECVSRVFGAVGADPIVVLFALAVQAARVRFAVDSTDYDSDRRLPFSLPR